MLLKRCWKYDERARAVLARLALVSAAAWSSVARAGEKPPPQTAAPAPEREKAPRPIQGKAAPPPVQKQPPAPAQQQTAAPATKGNASSGRVQELAAQRLELDEREKKRLAEKRRQQAEQAEPTKRAEPTKPTKPTKRTEPTKPTKPTPPAPPPKTPETARRSTVRDDPPATARDAQTTTLDWKELWSIPLGEVDGGGQVALRGPLVVAVAPLRGSERPSLIVVDGRVGKIVRSFEINGALPTSGVLLDGDHAIFRDAHADDFGPSSEPSPGSRAAVHKWRLDGRHVWSATELEPGFTLAAPRDLNGDGVVDVTLTRPGAITVLDGRTGIRLGTRPPGEWQLVETQGLLGSMPFEQPVPTELLPENAARTDRTPVVGVLFADSPRTQVWLTKGPRSQHSLVVVPSVARGLRVLELPAAGVPAIGDVDLDEGGTWDVVLLAKNRLLALATGIQADVSLPYVRGDVRASGEVPERLESIASYRSKLPRRDLEWWLRPEAPAADESPFQPGQAQPPAAPPTSLPKQLAEADFHTLAWSGPRRAAMVGPPGSQQAVVCAGDRSCSARALPAPAEAFTFSHRVGGPDDDDDETAWAWVEGGRLFRLPAFRRNPDGWQEVTLPPNGPVSDEPVRELVATPLGLALLRERSLSLLVLDGERVTEVRTVPFGVAELVACGERLFGNHEGQLVSPRIAGDLDSFALVPDAPRPVRSLSCNGRRLSLVTAGGLTLELPPGAALIERTELSDLLTWLMLLGVGFVVALERLRRRKKPPSLADEQVRRHFRVDSPLTSRSAAAPSQKALADGLLDFIDNPDSKPPLSVAVCGAWGSGKSSVMNIMHRELEKTGRHVQVWFNAWRYHREQDIARAFYQNVINQLRKQAGLANRLRVAWHRIKRGGAGKVLLSFALAGLVLGVPVAAWVVLGVAFSSGSGSAIFERLGVVSAATAGSATLVWKWLLRPFFKVVDLDPVNMFKNVVGRMAFVENFRDEFKLTFEALDHDAKLVIYVDDLDRCPPESVTDMLETLNHLCETEHVVLVLGVDLAAVERAIAVRFKDMIQHLREEGSVEEADTFGQRYLEKMVTVSVDVPPLDASVALAPMASGRAESTRPSAPSFARERLAERLAPRLLGPALAVAAMIVLGLGAWRFVDWSGVEQSLRTFGEGYSRWKAEGTEQKKQSGDGPGDGEPDEGAAARRARAGGSGPDGVAGESDPPGREAVGGARTSANATRPGGRDADGTRAQGGPFVQQPAAVAPARPPLPHPDDARARVQSVRDLKFLYASGLVVVALLLLAALARVWAARRRRLEARPPARDAPEFSEALQVAAAQLPPNPRTAIRFANFARFVYYLDRQRPESADADHYERDFFAVLLPYWKRQPLPDSGLARELSRWFVSRPGAEPPRQPPAPKSSGERRAANL